MNWTHMRKSQNATVVALLDKIACSRYKTLKRGGETSQVSTGVRYFLSHHCFSDYKYETFPYVDKMVTWKKRHCKIIWDQDSGFEGIAILTRPMEKSSLVYSICNISGHLASDYFQVVGFLEWRDIKEIKLMTILVLEWIYQTDQTEGIEIGALEVVHRQQPIQHNNHH